MVTFQATLSPTSLEKLMQELSSHATKLEESRLDIHEALADYAYERIMFYVPVDTGTLAESFVEEVSQDMAKIFTDLEYAKFVEFGTGIRGASSGYDSQYMSAESYSAEYAGQPAQKFVYQAFLDLERDYLEITRNVLRKKGLI